MSEETKGTPVATAPPRTPSPGASAATSSAAPAAAATAPEVETGPAPTATPNGRPATAPRRPADRPAAAAPRPTPCAPRKVKLSVARVDPWSVMKLAFLLAIALAIVALVAAAVLWSVLDSMGVFDSVSRTVESVTRDRDTDQGFDILTYVGFERVMTLTAVLAGVNVILMTALSTLGAFLYNLAASLVGGLHVTLTEDA